MSITLARLKTSLYCDCEDTMEHDAVITELITAVEAEVINYLENDDITAASNFDTTLERAVCKQIAYEFNRRKDLGLSSVSYPDGSVSKYEIEEFLPSVRKILERYRTISLGEP
jgi:hypothetical protein